MGNPTHDFKYHLHRFSHVLEQFGITSRALGVTAHGLHHEVLIDHYKQITGQEPPVRSGDTALGALDRHAREVTTYFESLLPDSRDIREPIARRYRARPIRAFDLLSQVGRNCVGALQKRTYLRRPAAHGRRC